MPKSILVPIDGSDLAERALPFAAWLHRATAAKVILVRALPTVNRMFVTNDSALRIAEARQREEARQAEEQTSTAAERLRGTGVAVTVRMTAGAPSSVIMEEAATQETDLIIMFTHGRSATERFLFGSVADELLLHGTVPLLLISPSCFAEWPREPGPRRVLVPLDGSPLAEAALPSAVDLARALEAELVLFHAAESDAVSDEILEYLEGAAAPLRSDGSAVRARSLVGPPAATILRMAREEGAQAIAMATHGRGGLGRVIAGSVATAVVRDAPAPVLAFRPANLRDA